MPKTILLEEYHLALHAPVGLRKEDYRAMLRALRGKRFHLRLRNAVRETVARYPSLNKVAFTLGR